jgi:hypothetical protein
MYSFSIKTTLFYLWFSCIPCNSAENSKFTTYKLEKKSEWKGIKEMAIKVLILRSFWPQIFPGKCLPIQTLLWPSIQHICISLTSFMSTQNSILYTSNILILYNTAVQEPTLSWSFISDFLSHYSFIFPSIWWLLNMWYITLKFTMMIPNSAICIWSEPWQMNTGYNFVWQW